MGKIDRKRLYYWDTSALVKRYATETGTPEVNCLVDDPDNLSFMAAVIAIEVHTAVNRKSDEGAISTLQRSSAFSAFAHDTANIPLLSIDILPEDIANAIDLAKTHGLNGAFDSLILAVGTRVFQKRKSDLVWVTCDRQMGIAANAEGFDVYNPNKGRMFHPSGPPSTAAPA